ncbi:hypothetical protein PT974_01856 [Cladobotryum mycophilum]|uniref:Uncharacterized protein n=1 Tax=Cladobotryum mycophilum TaxID=491253 RepID=A0ABR0SWG5_9HYPO
MQLFNFFLAAMAVLPLTNACKCWGYTGPNDPDGTPVDSAGKTCCDKFHGRWSGYDCDAHSIHDKLNSFNKCCKEQHTSTSDCWAKKI